MKAVLLVVGLVPLVGCSAALVPVIPGGPDTGSAAGPTDPTFEIIARSKGVKDPLPVTGANIAYADLERALSSAIIRSVRPRHESTLTVELISAEANYDHDRIAISFVARATLKKREGNAFVGQTQILCRDAGLVTPAAGTSVVWSCMVQLGRDLGGWLDGLAP